MPVPVARAVVGRTLLRDRAYEVLRDAIVDGTLAPGEQLREHDLQEWIGVSRTPIREALMRLERAGLVSTRPGHSTSVVPLDDVRVDEAVPVVAAMHALAARLATAHVGREQISAMRAANKAFAAALHRGDIDSALAADDELHDVVLALAGNRAVVDTLEQYSPLLRRAERARFAQAGEATVRVPGASFSVDLHTRLIDALAARDADAAADAALATWTTLDAHTSTTEPTDH